MTTVIKKIAGLTQATVKRIIKVPNVSDELYNSYLFRDANLQEYYRMEGNSNDATANARNGTDTNMVYSATLGKFGQYGAFNGSNRYINIPLLTLTNTSFSISLWFNVAANFSSVYELFSQGNTSANSSLLQICVSSATKIGLANRDNSSVGLDLDITVPTMAIDTWYHLVWTCTTTSSILYLNGAAIGSPTTFTANTGSYNTQNIGALVRASTIRYMLGNIDDFAIFNRILTAQEVANIYGNNIKKFGSVSNV